MNHKHLAINIKANVHVMVVVNLREKRSLWIIIDQN